MVSKQVLQNIHVTDTLSLYDMSLEKPVLLVFLRHFGCIFCQEALSELSASMQDIDALNVNLVFVHMSDTETACNYLSKHSLDSLYNISDPSCKIYADFSLVKGKVGQLFGLKVWYRGFGQLAKTNIPSLKQVGDSFQMPGVFLIYQGAIKNMYLHNSIADKPNYLQIIKDGLS